MLDGDEESQARSRWTPQELARGVDRYRRYLVVFGLDEDSFRGQTVCHIGCGPFGGVLAVLRGVARAYPVEVYARDLRSIANSATPLLELSPRTGQSPVPTRSCDAVFCLGATGDTTRWYILEQEARRICTIGGCLYLWWRPADDYWKHCTGRSIAKWNKTGGLTVDRMRGIFREMHWEWSNVSVGVDVPNLYPAIEARWAILKRVAD